MFRIRGEQIEEFGRRDLDRYVEETVRHLSRVFPEHAYSRTEEQLQRLVREAVDRGHRFGLTLEHTLRRFVDYHVEWGPAFLDDPDREWVVDILTDEELDEEQRINEIDRVAFGA